MLVSITGVPRVFPDSLEDQAEESERAERKTADRISLIARRGATLEGPSECRLQEVSEFLPGL